VGPQIPDDEAEKVGNTPAITLIATSLTMDPNAEERPPTAHIAEVDVDIQTEVRLTESRGYKTDGIGKSGTCVQPTTGTLHGELDI
jgi:hypothetical protein